MGIWRQENNVVSNFTLKHGYFFCYCQVLFLWLFLNQEGDGYNKLNLPANYTL